MRGDIKRGFMLRGFVLAAAVAFLPSLSLAGQVAVYAEPNIGNLTIEVADNGYARVSGRKPEQYLILRDGEAYLVGSDETGVNVAALSTVAAAMEDSIGPGLRGLFGEIAKATRAPTITAKPKGETATIAGVKGDVYLVSGFDQDPKVTSEFVVSKAADIALVGKAYQSFVESTMVMMAPMFGPSVSDMIGDMRVVFALGAPLKSEGRFELTSVKTQSVDPSRFELPAKPLTLEQVKAQFLKISGAP
jgi:hypothetical protein